MSGPHLEIVIVGVARTGQIFRPSDWAERLCGCMSLFGEDQRINYSPYHQSSLPASSVWASTAGSRKQIPRPSVFSCPLHMTTSCRCARAATRFGAQYSLRPRPPEPGTENKRPAAPLRAFCF